MLKDYKVLQVAPLVFKTLAWIGVSLGLISALVIFFGGATPETPGWMGIISLVVGVLYGFVFLVVSEGIELLLDMNSRIK
jgi:hypothetical protein